MTSTISLQRQVERGWLVCPSTHAPLRLEGNRLVGGARPYDVVDDKPVFLAHALDARDVHNTDASTAGRLQFIAARLGLADDNRTAAARDAETYVTRSVAPGELALSIGGGPSPAPPNFLNVNIFMGVDVVADAEHLPFSDGAVSAFLCEAVLEHLRHPTRAATEMFRCARNDALVFAATPFMQGYHGVPHHYQNFTIAGHRALFEDAGFVVEDAGVCVGPLSALSTQLAMQLGYLAGSVWVRRAGLLAARAVGKLDGPLGERLRAENLASSTYVVARKP